MQRYTLCYMLVLRLIQPHLDSLEGRQRHVSAAQPYSLSYVTSQCYAAFQTHLDSLEG
jgi:hypothetical protein